MAEPGRLCGPAAPTRGSAGGSRGSRCEEPLPSQGSTKPRHRPPRPPALDGLQWTFEKKGLDDFRKGCPPCEGLLTRGPQEAFLPQIRPPARRAAPNKRQRRWPEGAAPFPGLSPAQRARGAFLADVDAQLSPHPLALYPHLGEDMPVELLLKVLEVLDPGRKLEDTWAYCQGVGKRAKEPAKHLRKLSTQVGPGLPKKTAVSHPGQWLYEEKKPHQTDLLHEDGPLIHENVRRGVRDFCNWATTFGSSDIDEEFILKQFDIDCQSKPSHDVPHMVNQAPPELKKRVGFKKLQEPQFLQKPDSEQKLQKPQELLADLHGTTAFKDFILSRGYRMPSFLAKTYVRKERKCECNKTSIK
ncbi:protein FAM47E isoform X4 [Meles meles]|uniref:protein FAM47E isoform X4 n=1 Tax=Meles meles TaxID=9662 RepID=UPI001E69DAE4|nr:protein FAM47E isoform X4 [Meles meles]